MGKGVVQEILAGEWIGTRSLMNIYYGAMTFPLQTNDTLLKHRVPVEVLLELIRRCRENVIHPPTRTTSSVTLPAQDARPDQRTDAGRYQDPEQVPEANKGRFDFRTMETVHHRRRRASSETGGGAGQPQAGWR